MGTTRRAQWSRAGTARAVQPRHCRGGDQQSPPGRAGWSPGTATRCSRREHRGPAAGLDSRADFGGPERPARPHNPSSRAATTGHHCTMLTQCAPTPCCSWRIAPTPRASCRTLTLVRPGQPRLPTPGTPKAPPRQPSRRGPSETFSGPKARVSSLDDLGDRAGADGAATLTDGEAEALFDGDRLDQRDGHLRGVAGHDHLGALGKRSPRRSRRWCGRRTAGGSC